MKQNKLTPESREGKFPCFYRKPGLIILILFLMFASSYGQQTKISGIVTDMATNEPLIGVNVSLKGTVTGTVTNVDGEYSFSVPSLTGELVFSYVGYLQEEVAIDGRVIINMSLLPSMEYLDELVVVGYGMTKKSDLTGAISSVKGEDIKRMPVLNAGEAIQGKAAGVYVSRSSGRPGAESEIKIRGVGSINDIGPLWVVDGVQGATIGNINDIESIEILKDASAAAIYGTKAAGGVILVTTKRGGNQKTRFDLHSYYSSNNTMNFPDLLDANQYSRVLLSALERDGISTEEYRKYYDREWENSTNWKDEMFRTGFLHNHTLSASGGTENANYYVSGGFASEKGTYYKTGRQSSNFKVNSDIKISKWLKVGESLTFTTSKSNPDGDIAIYRNVMRATPTIPVMDPTNTRGGGYGYIPDSLIDFANWSGRNPIALMDLQDSYRDEKVLFSTVYKEVRPFKGLLWRTNLAGTFTWRDVEFFALPFYDSFFTKREYNELKRNLYTNEDYLLNSFINYNLEFGSHDISAMQGFESSYYSSVEVKSETRNIPDPEVRNTLLGDTDYLKSDMSNGHGAIYSYFGRLNYVYADKYLLTANYRLDASAKFGANYSEGFFPSVSGGWRISKESFMESISWLDDLKLRVGWGILGIDNIPSYMFAQRYRQYGHTGFGGPSYTTVIPGRNIVEFPNYSIRWERIEQWNYGIDYSFFRNQLTGSIEYYDKRTTDMLVNVATPYTSGFANARINNGEISNKGFDLALTYNQKINDLSLTISGNASRNFNNVEALRDPVGKGFFIPGGQNQVSRTAEGHPLASFYGYVADGIIRTQEELDLLNAGSPTGQYQYDGTSLGDIKFRDIASLDENGKIVMVPDGRITTADQTFIGNPWPNWVFGLTFRAEWKTLDFSMFWQGVYGIDIYNMNKIYTEALFSDYNSSTRILDAWSPENPGGNIPRVSFNDQNRNFQNNSTYFVEDGSYLRLKNIQLGYTLPDKLMKSLSMTSARVYISGLNQITLTNYTGVDPEFVSNTSGNNSQMVDYYEMYPQYKSWVFGIQIGF